MIFMDESKSYNQYLVKLRQDLTKHLTKITTPGPVIINNNLNMSTNSIDADNYTINGKHLKEYIRVDNAVNVDSLQDYISLGCLNDRN